MRCGQDRCWSLMLFMRSAGTAVTPVVLFRRQYIDCRTWQSYRPICFNERPCAEGLLLLCVLFSADNTVLDRWKQRGGRALGGRCFACAMCKYGARGYAGALESTALIFSSGKMVCTGSKSEEDARNAARKFARILQKLGNPVSFKEFKIQNMVGSCDVKFPIRLEGLATSHSMFCSYEPELFPGLIYRMQQPKIVLLIFVSDKIGRAHV